MRAAEEAAFASGVEVEALMDKAGAGVARAITKFFPYPGACIVYAGKGHNAGDALVAAECLRRRGWKIEIRLAFKEGDCGELMRKKLESLRKTSESRHEDPADEPCAGSACHAIILDGLLGWGSKPPLRKPVRTACRDLNQLRQEKNAYVFAVDLPTGIDGNSGKTDRDGVVADFTVTIGFAKPGLVADGALNFVGRLEVAPLDELRPPEKKENEIVACAPALRELLRRRKYDAYKNQFGRIGIVAGSKGFTGAAIMCSLGALRAGAGLVEVFVPEEIYELVAAAAPPEAMVKPVKSYRNLLKEKIDVWALGPGLGKSRADEILELIEKATRATTATKFCRRFPVTLLLKGSRTIVAERDHPLSYNTTGNPGMATGGMGDILTGVCAGLVGQRLSLYDAARLGAWVCGRAAEIAIFNDGQSEQSLLPRDVLDHLGDAFNEVRG